MRNTGSVFPPSATKLRDLISLGMSAFIMVGHKEVETTLNAWLPVNRHWCLEYKLLPGFCEEIRNYSLLFSFFNVLSITCSWGIFQTQQDLVACFCCLLVIVALKSLINLPNQVAVYAGGNSPVLL